MRVKELAENLKISTDELIKNFDYHKVNIYDKNNRRIWSV